MTTPHDLHALLHALAPLAALHTGAQALALDPNRVQSSRIVAEPAWLAAASDSGDLAAARRASATLSRCPAVVAPALRWLAERATGEGSDPAAMALDLALSLGPGDLRARLDVLRLEHPQARGVLAAMRRRRPRGGDDLRAWLRTEGEVTARERSLGAELREVERALRRWGEDALAAAVMAWRVAEVRAGARRAA